MELYTAFTKLQNRTLIHCHKYPTPPSCRHGRTSLPGVYSSAVLNVDLARPGNPSGCRTASNTTNALRDKDFSAVLDMKPSGREPPSAVPYFGGVPVVSVHFNGYCKGYICIPALCDPVKAWAGSNQTLHHAFNWCCP